MRSAISFAIIMNLAGCAGVGDYSGVSVVDSYEMSQFRIL